ncbi:ciliary basal body-associated, B9 protein-domain-containing protein [Blastocladiella britannica]|nr:ciliary basal body-associated, B9 protein-domain-containing protein [Blastocladiella britannica]
MAAPGLPPPPPPPPPPPLLKQASHQSTTGRGGGAGAVGPGSSSSGSTTFTLHLSGELESVQSAACKVMYARLELTAGPDWSLQSGTDQVLTQLAFRHVSSASASGAAPGPPLAGPMSVWWFLVAPILALVSLFMGGGMDRLPAAARDSMVAVWSCPWHAVFRSANPFGWPHAVVGVYGLDAVGRDVLVGYASARIPRSAGRHVIYAPIFTPLASSPFNGFLSSVLGRPPELLDSTLAARSDSRHALRVRSDGLVKLVVNVAFKDMAKLGYLLESPH